MTKRKRRVEQLCLPEELPMLVESLAQVWMLGAAPKVVQNACVAGARFAVEYLRRVGVEAWATQVDALALDEQSYQDVLAKRNPTGWSVGALSLTTVPNTWNGHVVVETQDWFIDLTAGQMSRPHKEITILNGLCVPTEKLLYHENVWQGEWYEVPVSQGHYLFRDAVVQRDITTAPDWHGGLELLRDVVKLTD